jgi:hypothetical protein
MTKGDKSMSLLGRQNEKSLKSILLSFVPASIEDLDRDRRIGLFYDYEAVLLASLSVLTDSISLLLLMLCYLCYDFTFLSYSNKELLVFIRI